MSNDTPVVLIVGCASAVLGLIVLLVMVIVICVHKKRLKKRSITLFRDCPRIEDANVKSGADGKYQIEPYSSVACHGNDAFYASVEIKHLTTFQVKHDQPKRDVTIILQEEDRLSNEGEMVTNAVYESYSGEGSTAMAPRKKDVFNYVQKIDTTYETLEPPNANDETNNSAQYSSDEGFVDNAIYESYNPGPL